MRKAPEPAGEAIPNLAPLVDVIMVLLVFFLLIMSFDLVRQGILSTELDPNSGPGAGARVEVNPTIAVSLGGSSDETLTIRVRDEALPSADFELLRRYLEDRRRAGADPKNAVVIVAETQVRWHHVIQAMDAIIRAGFANVQFGVSMRPGSV